MGGGRVAELQRVDVASASFFWLFGDTPLGDIGALGYWIAGWRAG